MGMIGKGISKAKKKNPPDEGLEPSALRLKVSRANQLCQPGFLEEMNRSD
jgi:hypothetical protein